MPQIILNTQHIATASLSLSLPLSISICAARQPNSSLGHLFAEVLRSHATGRTPANEGQMVARMQQQTRGKNIHVLSGIRTCDPSNKEAAGIRPHGHHDRHNSFYIYEFYWGPYLYLKAFRLP